MSIYNLVTIRITINQTLGNMTNHLNSVRIREKSFRLVIREKKKRNLPTKDQVKVIYQPCSCIKSDLAQIIKRKV